jgi:hypothetical protein
VCLQCQRYAIVCALLQGLTPCGGCNDRCYQCGEKDARCGEDSAYAWDLGEIYGLANPTRLPSPTTSSLARTVIIRPHEGTFSSLDIRDAERAQGMAAGYTAVPMEHTEHYTQKGLLKTRFRCVGNALPGKVMFSPNTCTVL